MAGDGLTVGLVDTAGLVTSRLLGDDTVPAPDRNLTLIATLTTGDLIWLVQSDGPIASVDDLFRTAEQRPILLPVSDAGGVGFASSAETAALLGIRHEFVSGYSGFNEVVAALLRNEGDAADFDLTTVCSSISGRPSS